MRRADVIRRADLDDLDTLTSVVADSYHQSAVAAWLVADPGERLRVLHSYIRVHILHALRFGQVWTIDAAAVAVWLPHAGVQTTRVEDPQPWLDLACGRYADAFRMLTTLIDAARPAGPHQHLTVLAVATARRRCRLGSRLLQYPRRQADLPPRPEYVAACGVTSRDLLLRHAFRDHGPPIDLPDGPRLWPLLRHHAPRDRQECR